MVDLKNFIANAVFQSGRVLGENDFRDIVNLSWNGRANDSRGFVRRGNFRCEDGNIYDVIQMHPKWIKNGSVKAILPLIQIPQFAVFRAKIGFLNGALGTDGATFQVWVHNIHRGREVKNRVFNFNKKFTNQLVDVDVDLSFLAGKNAKIELKVDAGNSSGRDWAVWIDPVIESRTINVNSKVWGIRPYKLEVNKRNETRRIEGRGDEPYIGGLYFRSIFGKPGTTKVSKIDDLSTLGNNLKGTVNIGNDANLTVFDSGISWDDSLIGFFNGIQIMGYIFVAMEEDKRGKKNVRSLINETGDKLYDSLVRNIEANPLGILNTKDTLEKIQNDLKKEGGGFFGGFIKEKILSALQWVARGDDFIGQNQIIFIGLSEQILKDQLKDKYNPSSKISPFSSLSERTFNLEFEGSGAKYTLYVNLEESSEGVLE